MMRKSHLAYGLVAAYLATFLLAVSPPVSAQQGEHELTIEVQDAPTITNKDDLNSGRLRPETSQLKVQFTFLVTVPQLTACEVGSVQVTFEVVPDSKAPYANPILSAYSQSQVYPPQGGVSNDAKTIRDYKTTMTADITRAAPAFTPVVYKVRAKASVPGASTSAGCNLKASSTPAESSISVQNDYIAVMQYQPAKYIQKSGQNKEVIFSIKMTNFGNGGTKVNTVVDPLSKNKLDAIIPPSQLTLESKALNPTAVNSQDALITGRTPHANGYTNSLYSIQATFTATAVQAITETGNIAKDIQTVALSVQVQGVYVPGFDPASAIGALGIGLLLVGFARRRSE